MSTHGVAGSQDSALQRILATAPRDIFAGLVTSVMAVAYGLSFAALIFAPPLTPWIAYGIAATFVTSAVSAAIVAMRSSLPFAIAGPDGATAAVTATLVAALLARLNAEGAPDDLLAPVMIVMALTAALTGLVLCGLGLARAGAAIRFVPYPVIGGFLGATGWLMFSGAVRVVTDHGVNFSTLATLLDAPNLAKLAATVAVSLALYLGLRRRGDNPYVLPAVLLAGIALAHITFALAGTTMGEARVQGWMFRAPAAVGITRTWDFGDLQMFPWRVLPALAGDLFAVMFVTAITVLLNTTGIEFVTKREADLGRELNTLGIANLTVGALGGYVGCISLSRTTLNYASGGRGRICGLVVAIVSALVLIADPGFLAYVPKFVLGGLLLYLGSSLMYAWLVESARRISLLEYVSLLAITLLIVQAGFIAGVLIGVIIGCATFAVSASRVNAVKFTFDSSEYRSSLDRGPSELAILSAHGHEIQGMSLQSYLFFGSANRLYEQVKALFAAHPDCRFLVFDFRLVTGIDSSATHSFTQIKHAADEIGAKLVLVHVSPGLRGALEPIVGDGGAFSDDLDRALEACERGVIAAHARESGEAGGLREWFAQAVGGGELADQLMRNCERLEFHSGDVIARQGEPADSMLFIVEGRVGVIVKPPNGPPVRVRSLGPHTTIGEMGLISRQARSATVRAEEDSVLYALTLDAYDRIRRDNAELSQALLTYIVNVMAERLGYASKAIGVLRR